MAEAYDGGGRTIDQARIRAVFAAELERGKTLFDRYQSDVRPPVRLETVDPLEQRLGKGDRDP